MRIAFLVIGNSRRSNYLNGYNLRYGGGGGSGGVVYHKNIILTI